MFLHEEIFTRRSYAGPHGCVAARAGAVVLDVGANVGLFALWAASVAAPGATVYAIEPMPDAVAVLRQNVAQRPAPARVGVEVLSVAVGERDAADVPFYWYAERPAESTRHPEEAAELHRALYGADSEAPAAREVRCEVRALGSLMAQLRLPRVDFLKVDCEGDELDCLRGIGSEENWSKIDRISVEVHDVEGRLAAVEALLRRHGFHVQSRQQRSTLVRARRARAPPGGQSDVTHTACRVGVDALAQVAGYQTTIPDSLRLHYVYAARQPLRPPTPPAPPAAAPKRQRAVEGSDAGNGGGGVPAPAAAEAAAEAAGAGAPATLAPADEASVDTPPTGAPAAKRMRADEAA